MNVLIPNIGRRGYLVRYIKEISSFDGKIYVSDCDMTASGLYGENDGFFILPKPVDDEKKYVQDLLKLCDEKCISVIIPVIDPEIYILAKYREVFQKHNVLLMVSDENVLNICYNKLAMNKFLAENDFVYPKTFENIEDFEHALKDNEIEFPVYIKPIWGSGSEATYKVENIEKVKSLFREELIIQEYINGQEFGVDVFNNLNQEPLRCVIKKKISMRAGETDKAISVKDNEIQGNIVKLARCLKHIGNLDCDVIVRQGKVYIIDLNPRFGGGYPGTHESGVNLLELVLRIAQGQIVEPEFENYKENVLVMKEVGIVSAEVTK